MVAIEQVGFRIPVRGNATHVSRHATPTFACNADIRATIGSRHERHPSTPPRRYMTLATPCPTQNWIMVVMVGVVVYVLMNKRLGTGYVGAFGLFIITFYSAVPLVGIYVSYVRFGKSGAGGGGGGAGGGGSRSEPRSRCAPSQRFVLAQRLSPPSRPSRLRACPALVSAYCPRGFVLARRSPPPNAPLRPPPLAKPFAPPTLTHPQARAKSW